MERTINGLPPVHPGEHVREALDDLGITQAALAKSLGVSAMRISHLVREERPVTAELALRLGRTFGQSPQYWLNLQAAYDLKMAKSALTDELANISPLLSPLAARVGCGLQALTPTDATTSASNPNTSTTRTHTLRGPGLKGVDTTACVTTRSASASLAVLPR